MKKTKKNKNTNTETKKNLFHVSSWAELETKETGDSFTLKIGTQCAEGKGVYFSEKSPRYTAAEGAYLNGIAAVIVINPEKSTGWWRTKSSVCKKHNRPRTWHSDNKNVTCQVEKIEKVNNVNYLHCSFNFS